MLAISLTPHLLAWNIIRRWTIVAWTEISLLSYFLNSRIVEMMAELALRYLAASALLNRGDSSSLAILARRSHDAEGHAFRHRALVQLNSLRTMRVW